MPATIVERAIADYQNGRWADAELACADVLRRDPSNPDALQILGNIRARSGDTRAAEPLLERARDIAPGNIFVLNSLGGVYAANGRLHEARAALEAALAIDNRFPWALQNLGALLVELGDRAGARRLFERALQFHADHAETIASLADLAEREHRVDEATRLAERAVSVAPALPLAQLVLARLQLRRGDFAEVETAVGRLLRQDNLSAGNRAAALGLLGEALDGLGRYQDAFVSFAAANDIERRLHAQRFAGAASAVSLETIRRLTALVQTADRAAWQNDSVEVDREPVFLVGFPRSGTTLLDQVLASHPDIDLLEERESLVDSVVPLVIAEGALDRWSTLTAQEIGEFRRSYWRRVEAGLGRPCSRPVFVDKLPLNIVLLPLIYRLFPRARIILALRDPRDVVLSCFKNRFALNPAMFQFLSLDTTARYYDAVMLLGETTTTRWPLAVHALRYEDVVGDFRATIGGLLEFLGLGWTDEVANYGETARRRKLSTPSAAQVVKPLYRSSLGKWRHYATELHSVMPILERWVQAFGYESA